MDAKQKRQWVTALKALQTAAGFGDVPNNQLRDWGRSTLAGITSAALDARDLDDISDAFLESVQKNRNLVQAPERTLFRYQTDWKNFPLVPPEVQESRLPRQLGQVTSSYPLTETSDNTPAPYPANPYISPTTYLLHPSIDVLDQETITKISSRDTGA